MAMPVVAYRGLKWRWLAGRRRLSVARRAIFRVFEMDVTSEVKRELFGEMYHQVVYFIMTKKRKKIIGYDF